ncbi:MAG TPA: mechanosensitive ion channel domain-containing protein [Acetobacteraceae bacterium]|nr:mechanosensitive ion channel domain-containing protein [Acetobacteraceae bacterium]
MNFNWANALAAHLRRAFYWAPPWVVSVLILTIAAVAALFLYRWLFSAIIRLARRAGPFADAAVRRSEGPGEVIWLVIVLGAALAPAQLSYAATIVVAHMLLVAFICAVGWGALRVLDLGSEFYLGRFRMDAEDNLLARKHVTQVNILRRTAQTLIVLVTVAAALMTFATVRQYGVSLFASAGAAGLVVGLAARPILSNLFAGIQIAMTQPIRVEDAVVVEGEWGWIETIASTYVVIRIWDLRRLIVPLSYFIERPFQNWTHESAALLGPIILYLDYSVPMDRLRAKLDEILDGHRLWDKRAAAVQMIDATEHTVQVRVLVSARNASSAFDLRCQVREQLLHFLQTEYPEALPRRRTELVGAGARWMPRAVEPAERAAPPPMAHAGAEQARSRA